jgi:AAA domain
MALEVLSPPVFRQPEDLVGGDKQAVARLAGKRLPWEDGGEEPKLNTRLYYQLILGTVSMKAATDRLTSIYRETRIEPRAVRGKAMLAVILLDRDGVPVRASTAAVSSFAWGLPRALEGKLESLSEWPGAEKLLNDKLDARLRQTDDDGTVPPLNIETIQQAFLGLVSSLGLPPEMIEAPRCALRIYERLSNPHPPEPLLLNSFFLNYLAVAIEQFGRNAAPANLKCFLGTSKPKHRRDLLNDNASLMSAIRPHLFSPARWPGPGRHPLVLLQQAAVNLALEELKDGGILAVNGPPGTGKTTLLRDIVAALVTERARVMAGMSDPAAAFIASGQHAQAGNGRFQIYRLDPTLRGFEILVASSNNNAVENISAELPGAGAIATDAPTLRFFKTTSDALQTSRRNSTWGLIAAVLGNMANRTHFKKIFWWDKDVGLGAYLLAASGSPQTLKIMDPDTGEPIERPPKSVTNEDAPINREDALRRWQQARLTFQNALARSETILGELESLSALHEAERALHAARHALEAAHVALSQLKLTRPAWWTRLLWTPRFRAWRNGAILRRRIAKAAAATALEAQEKTGLLQAALQRTVRLSSAHDDADPIGRLRARIGTRLVDDKFFARTRSEYQQEAPWLDDAAHRVRDDVFVAAMALHKAFIDAAAKPLRHNLGALMTSFGGRSSPDTDKDALQADLWASLFLVVPVVSTTFASVERMLGRLPPEALGWLLIDEAGQAAPQAAVGALMRTRRAVVVGDPMQLEPVVTLPNTLTEMICRRFGVDPERFNAPVASVQTLADEATSCMAEFTGQNGSRTVGVPLLIHRRCAEPMFGLSNAVAYDRLMIHARAAQQSPIRALLGSSRWFDIRGEAIDKWCPQEGHCAVSLLRKLANANVRADLYVVTPFVLVQDRLREVVLKSGVLDSWVADPREWVRQRIGTVHVVQGREAEAVIFVLGAQGPQHAGARHWAGERPNLLNVAASRAKEALYVIGNRALWRSAGHFDELDAQMPQSTDGNPERLRDSP